jgi:hypothetical protein
MNRIEERWWLGGAVRQTYRPMLAVAAALALLGATVAITKPGAKSIGDLWRPAPSIELERER